MQILLRTGKWTMPGMSSDNFAIGPSTCRSLAGVRNTELLDRTKISVLADCLF
jgi:hypothetical protein